MTNGCSKNSAESTTCPPMLRNDSLIRFGDIRRLAATTLRRVCQLLSDSLPSLKSSGKSSRMPQSRYPHRLRHTFATEMLGPGVSLSALVQLLGHNDISMTLRYLQVTPQDLQREFRLACQTIARRHLIPKLALPDSS